jgi:hypothetical protein
MHAEVTSSHSCTTEINWCSMIWKALAFQCTSEKPFSSVLGEKYHKIWQYPAFPWGNNEDSWAGCPLGKEHTFLLATIPETLFWSEVVCLGFPSWPVEELGQAPPYFLLYLGAGDGEALPDHLSKIPFMTSCPLPFLPPSVPNLSPPLFWDKVSLCSSGWPWTCYLSASTTWVLGLQLRITPLIPFPLFSSLHTSTVLILYHLCYIHFLSVLCLVEY